MTNNQQIPEIEEGYVYKIINTPLEIMKLSSNKRWGLWLYEEEINTYTKLATFINKEDAVRFILALGKE